MDQLPKESNIFVQEVFSSSSGATTRKRGQWNNARRLAAIDAMLQFRPFHQKQRKKGPAWGKIFDSVNNASPYLKPLGRSAIREQINKLIQEAKENRQSPLYVFETLLERQTLKLTHLMEEKTARHHPKRKTVNTRQQQAHESSCERYTNDTNEALSPISANSQIPSEEEPAIKNTSFTTEPILEREFRSALMDIKDSQESHIQQFDSMISHMSKSDSTLNQISLQLQVMTQQQHTFFSYMSKKLEEMATRPSILFNSPVPQ